MNIQHYFYESGFIWDFHFFIFVFYDSFASFKSRCTQYLFLHCSNLY